ncbi:MAG: HypC/HybG/HupF family hydrogenase formation chaperone [Gammaproteobacteria bacterium]|nr:HypC/HybG/HupF family hydrogenase formation chaperone [Gammaproteobacteria bacterium]MBT3488845.1 HypC/HybG/HupF family hydrogenase formation chaperone [Gammaproteobacteria bacterium]MBT3718812.1 HypC/HybG/HupF family hydrogenase formation chaperone [Gammaproteobacteria bacterium]MBT3845874.1 HypC/HybG/HupF family hydrogenase formation chaperone [Gammaproteobacteria bacterium]MBT3894247.1 HypC/HybG/HupF family hydrogenase formation chaperone [Gammaproteobacteria bacterium]
MCFGIPMQIKSIDRFIATCEAKGFEREVNLFMLQYEELAVGDYIVSHLGQATQKVSEDEARVAWELYDEMSQPHA